MFFDFLVTSRTILGTAWLRRLESASHENDEAAASRVKDTRLKLENARTNDMDALPIRLPSIPITSFPKKRLSKSNGI